MGMTEVFRGTAGALRWQESAREWLGRHRLPAGDATVGFVAERLQARRRGRWLSLAALVAIVVLVSWLVGRYQVDDEGLVWLATVVAASVAGDIVRHRLVWDRWDRRLIAGRSVQVATLSPPTWDDLVGRRALRRGAVLLGAGLVLVVLALVLSGPAAAVTGLIFLVAAAVHAGALLEVACRRSMPAGDETAVAVNDRLRGEEASRGAPKGLRWVLMVPLVAGVSDPTVMLCGFVAFLVGYLSTSGATRHRYAYEQVGGQLVAR